MQHGGDNSRPRGSRKLNLLHNCACVWTVHTHRNMFAWTFKLCTIDKHWKLLKLLLPVRCHIANVSLTRCVRACECACKLTSTDGRLEVSHWIAFSQSVQQLWRRQQQNNIAFQAVLCSLDSHSCYPATVGAVHSGARGAKKRKPSHKLSCSTIIKIYGRSARFNTCDIYIFHFITIRLS